VAKLLTTKWPLAAFVSELATQLEHRDLLLEVAWVPRELNAEADAITNDDVAWLDKNLEVSQPLSEIPFMVLNQMLARGDEFYDGLETVNAFGTESKKDPQVLLKVSDPWD
jgi:hypothetical protein